ncbi:MAG: molybdopterin oxidoreductase, partial [Chloroflexi bacterium]|nr:molybdopterin oxidoreductase [Chloroflexota bacterium]
MSENGILDNELSRRDFLKCSAFLGGSALAAGAFSQAWVNMGGQAEAAPQDEYPLAKPESIIYSVCQQCNTQCGIKVKIQNGVAVKIDGSPYNPFNLNPHISYKTPVAQAASIDAGLCPKGQAGIQTSYDPYRL